MSLVVFFSKTSINGRRCGDGSASVSAVFASAQFIVLPHVNSPVSDLVDTGSRVDYRMAMPRLFAFYLPRVLVPDGRKIEDTVKKAIQ